MVDVKKQFIAELTPEAEQQLLQLEPKFRVRIAEAIKTFEYIGLHYKNLNTLKNGLYEIKPSGVRAYFMYDTKRRRIIIIGFICLKKTQKAPDQFMRQAIKNIEKYLKEVE